MPLRATPPRISLAALCAVAAGSLACSANGVPSGRVVEPPSAPCAGRELVAATYNIRFDTAADGVHQWSSRRTQVGEQIRALSADLISLQEVLARQLDDLEAMLPGYAREGIGRDDGARGGEFAPLFYAAARFHREAGGTFWLSPTPDHPAGRFQLKPWGTLQNRIATWLLLRDRASGETFLVIGTHFDHWSDLARRESARLVVDFTARHPADHVVVMGDINARTGSAPHRILAAALRDAATAPSVTLAPTDTTVTAWTVLGAPHHHIDHILVSPRLRPLTYQVVDRRFVYAGAARYPSDHLPVRARFCIEPAGR